MDNFLLHAITNELHTALTGQRLGKVYQLGATDLLLNFRLRDGRWLCISTDPQRLALYLTTRGPRQFFAEARQDTGFPALLKKHLSGAQLLGVEKLGYDRVVTFTFAAENEAGQPVQRALVVSLIGRAANVLLLEDQNILASLRTQPVAPESYREPAPPLDKLDPFLVEAATLGKLADETAGGLAAAVQQHLLGFTPLYAAELAHRAAHTNAHTGAHAALTALLHELFEQPPQPHLYAAAPLAEVQRNPDLLITLSPISLTHLTAPHIIPFPSVNQAADAYFTLLEERRALHGLRQQLHSQLSAKLKKQRALLANLTREMRRRDVRYGLETMCIGGGQGIAAVFEKA